MKNPPGRNNFTLLIIPEFLQVPNYIGKPNYNVWSFHIWIRDNPFLPSYQVWLYYNFSPDPRVLPRAEIKNFLDRSSKIEIYCKGIRLYGDELKAAKLEIKERLLHALDRKSLLGYKVPRYVFNIVATLPKVVLKGFHSHHESRYNLEMVKIAERNGMTIPEHWLRATDDRFDNVSSLTPEAHKLEHIYLSDTGYFQYNDSKKRADYLNEISLEVEEIEQGNVVEGKWVNNWNDRVSEFWDYDNLMAKLQVFYNSGLDGFEQRKYANLLTNI
jgi:hypothetical protein